MTLTVIEALDRTSPTFRADVDQLFGTDIPLMTSELSALQVDVAAKQALANTSASQAVTAANTAVPAAATAVAAKDISVALKPTQSATPPASPIQGSQWTNSNTGRHYIYYVDSNGGHWVEPGSLIVDNPTVVGALVATLNSSSGAAETGYIADAPGAVASTTEEKLNRRKDIFDFLNPAERVDVMLADPVLDHTASIIDYLEYAFEGPLEATFPAITMNYTALPNLARENFNMDGAGKGRTFFRCTAAGVAMYADAFEPGFAAPLDDEDAPFVHGCRFTNFTIVGNEDTTSNFLAQGLSEIVMDIEVRDGDVAEGIAFDVRGCMSSEWRPTCSVDASGMTLPPYEGFRLSAGTRAGESVGSSSNNLIPNMQINGLHVGVRNAGADQNFYIGGASQSCLTYGMLTAAGARYNTVMNFGMESLASTADLADAGDSTQYINTYTSNKAIFQGSNAEMVGGTHERVQIDAGAENNSFRNLRLNNWRTGHGGFFDAGTDTTFANLKGTTSIASFATNVMNVTVATQGPLAVGQKVYAEGVADGTTITAIGTVVNGVGDYTLSTSPGTLSARAVMTDGAIAPYPDRVNITVTGSGTFDWKNTSTLPVTLIIQGGGLTALQMRAASGDNWLIPHTLPASTIVRGGDSVRLTFTGAAGDVVMSYVRHNSH